MKSNYLFYRISCILAAVLTFQACFYIPDANYEDYDYRRAYDDERPLRGPGSRVIPASESAPAKVAARTPSETHRGNDRIFHYDEIINRVAKQYNIDYHLLLAIGQAESSGIPTAVSGKDCHGLMQLKLSTARDYAPMVSPSDLYDPQLNLDIAGKHMVFLLRQVNRHYPNVTGDDRIVLLAAAWNAGWGNIRKADGVPNFPETQTYVKRVLELYHKYKAQRFLAG